MQQQKSKREFQPWSALQHICISLFSSGLGLVFVGVQWEFGFFVFSGIAILFASLIGFARVGARKHGKRIEQKAIREIRLPSGWEAKPNVLVQNLGDIDLLIKSSKKEQFAIEIKSHACVSYNPGGFFEKEKFFSRNKEIVPCPIAQITKSAETLCATPVIWFPEARQKKRFKTKGKVLVVQGNARALLIGIGAKSWFSIF